MPTKARKKIDFSNPYQSAFYEGFIAGRYYGGVENEALEKAKTPGEEGEALRRARRETLGLLEEQFDVQVDVTKEEGFWVDGVNRNAQIEECKDEAWETMEAVVDGAIECCDEIGEETLVTALGMIGR